MAERRVGPVRGHAYTGSTPDGRAHCECGVTSARMGAERRRTDWHRGHRQQVIRAAGAETALRRQADGPGKELDAVRAEVELLRGILGNLWLYVDWRYCTKQLATEQKEAWAAAVEGWQPDPERPEEPVQADRWWLCPTCGVSISNGRDDGPHSGCMYAHDAEEEADRG